MTKRKLPISGVQTFSKLRNEYDVYVDKTMHIYEMASRYTAVFLSRPRRFGKSLLCSTIEALFKGQKELFEGLAVEKTNWEWKEYPIIHMGLGSDDFTKNGLETLIGTINNQLDKVCEDYGISIDKNGSISNRFARVITALSDKLDRVVIIIDEYDNPLFNTFDQPELNKSLRETMKGFYSVIKQYDAYIRFTFITGITKFSQVSLFSGLNQAKDISMMKEYSDICGITQEELESNFEPEIDMYAQKYDGREKYLNKLREYYNGYFFTKEPISVYNTYRILNHFDTSAEFDHFWSKSSIPSFLIKYLEINDIDYIDTEEILMDNYDFYGFADNSIDVLPLMHDAGFLVISEYMNLTDYKGYYKMNYPNINVQRTFESLLSRENPTWCQAQYTCT